MNNASLSTTYYVIYSFVLLFFALPAKAQKEAETYNVDPELYAYYQRCKERLLQPIVLSMSDTLFHMAGNKNDKRMQAVALTTQLDYYYYQANHEDSVIHYTNKVKEFALQTNQSKYYYFAWANRLILYYIKSNKNNIALYEAQKMLEEAQKEDDKIGLMYCYNVMSQTYSAKGFDSKTTEWRMKEIELVEKYKLENYNLANNYNQMAMYYIENKQQEKALEALEKGIACSNSESHKISLKLTYISYYIAFNNIKKAHQELLECQDMFLKDKRLDYLKKKLYSTQYLYYKATSQYPKALEAINNQEIEERRQGGDFSHRTIYRLRGELYDLMGNSNEATKNLLEYAAANDSLKLEDEQRTSGEFATLLDVENLNTEKKELMLQSQEKEIRNKTTLIISLIVLLCFLFVFLYRENRLNRRLKLSEGELKIKNEELTDSREELRKAKTKAEDKSQMKTTFIQNMSHEIRTPLNSIVGFSDVLSDMYCKEFPETKEFVDIIKSNTNDLLRLVSDVLTLSELDQNDEVQTDIKTNIHELCQLSIDMIETNKQKDIKISFTPEKENLEILNNPERLSVLLSNLLYNAYKFTQHGSINIAYTIFETEKMLQISVTDTGIGIPIEKQEEVFERFFKMNTFTQGTGLGLPICRSIAEKLGGSLIIDSSYTKGCRMLLTIPITYA